MKKLFFAALIAVMVVMGCKEDNKEDPKPNPVNNGPCVKTLKIINETSIVLLIEVNGLRSCGAIVPGNSCSWHTTQNNTYSYKAIPNLSMDGVPYPNISWSGTVQGECFDQSIRLTY